MKRLLKILFVLLVARPVVMLVLGLNIRNRNGLPLKGPAVIAANHNSHLDTMVLLSLYPLSVVHRVRPVAAADYFLSSPLFAWFALNVIDIIPISRSGHVSREQLFDECTAALEQGDILILFPEGTRGEPEQRSHLKKGIYYMTRDIQDIRIIPVFTHGLGRALPRGEALLVPFNCDVVVGDALGEVSSATELLQELAVSFEEMQAQCLTYHGHEKG